MTKRYDYTQRLYDEFISGKNGQLLGFSADGIKVLTDDVNIFNVLYKAEVERLTKNVSVDKGKVYKIIKYQSLGLGEGELSSNLVLNEELKYAIACQHQKVDDWMFRNFCGGGRVVILASNKDRIAESIPALIDAYLKEMEIERTDLSYDRQVPSLFMQISINNRELDLPNEGEFNTRLGVLSSVETLNKEIENASLNIHEKSNSNERKR